MAAMSEAGRPCCKCVKAVFSFVIASSCRTYLLLYGARDERRQAVVSNEISKRITLTSLPLGLPFGVHQINAANFCGLCGTQIHPTGADALATSIHGQEAPAAIRSEVVDISTSRVC